jgi:hypothetical protein
MAANRTPLGFPYRAGIELPAPCVGHVLGKGVGSCANDGSITLLALIENDAGGPMPVIVTVCPEHVRGARVYLEHLGQGDEIESYATSTFAEHFDLVESSGLNPWRLMATG